MDKVTNQIQVLIEKAKEGKPNQACREKDESPSNIASNVRNSLAETIKTQEQANAFMTLLKAF